MPTPASYSWMPSVARVVMVDGCGVTPRGAWLTPTAALCWPAKDPGETLDYVFDVSQALLGNEGDAIATLDIAISPANPGDLTVQSASADGPQAIIWLSAGFAGTSYAVTITVGTNSGRVIARTVNLPVVALANLPAAENAITDQSGVPITTQTGSDITTS